VDAVHRMAEAVSLYLPIYEWAARTHRVDADLLEALAIVHTAELPTDVRYGSGERRYWRQAIRGASAWRESPYWQQPSVIAARFGLLSVPYHAALQMGMPWDQPPEGLLDPWTGVHYGARWLACLVARHHGSVSAGVAAYQSGWGRAQVGSRGRFTNWRYVERVMRACDAARARNRSPQAATAGRSLACATHSPDCLPIASP